MTAADLQRVTAKMKREAEAAGARIDEVVYCPHAPDAGCNCRKPRPGLLQALVDASGCPVDQTILVGDAMRDLQAARALGIRALRVRTGKGRTTERGLRQEAVEVFDDLAAAAHAIIDGRVDKGEAD
jgi:D-glycero-D-manno-heptose 1,7-bisphosphate phosphatase